jgi:hypothetical protein
MKAIGWIILGFGVIYYLNQGKRSVGAPNRLYPGTGLRPTSGYNSYPPTLQGNSPILTGNGSLLAGAGSFIKSISSIFTGQATVQPTTQPGTVPRTVPTAGNSAADIFQDPALLDAIAPVPVETAIAQGTDNTFDATLGVPYAFDGTGAYGYGNGSGGYPEGNAAGLAPIAVDPSSAAQPMIPSDFGYV